MYKIHQFSCQYLEGTKIGEGNGISLKQLQKLEDILGKYNQVVQIGIQAPPGTLFIINAGSANTSSEIEIGDTGIFELDFKNSNTYITSLRLAIPSKYLHKQSTGEYLAGDNFGVIVDILYEG